MKSSLIPRIGAVIPPLLFLFAVVFFSVLYGMAAMQFRWFPYQTLDNARQLPKALFPGVKQLFWEFSPTQATDLISVRDTERMQPGLTKVVDLEADLSLAIKVIDTEGNIQQRWRINWDEVWPEAPDYLKDAPDLPRARPGTHIHGAEILDNGDVVFNFEHLSLVRMDPCGNVVWKLPFRTHHSVFIDDDRNIWVSAQVNHTDPLPDRPFMKPPIIEPYILKVSPEGQILEQKSVFDLLTANHLQSLLYSTSVVNFRPMVTDDLLHLNDVEVFSRTMSPGFFQPGDILVSLRNVSTVLVFDPHWQLKYSWTGDFVRQHDPDFVDGDTLSVLDNNNVTTRKKGAHSRVLRKNVVTGSTEVVFQGTEQQPFFTYVMGKLQWLANGNLLVAESVYGRALELTPQNEIVWEMNNVVEPGWTAILEEVERLPAGFDAAFFADARHRCEADSASH